MLMHNKLMLLLKWFKIHRRPYFCIFKAGFTATSPAASWALYCDHGIIH